MRKMFKKLVPFIIVLSMVLTTGAQSVNIDKDDIEKGANEQEEKITLEEVEEVEEVEELGEPSLKLAVNMKGKSYKNGDTIGYEIKLINDGEVDLEGIKVKEDLNEDIQINKLKVKEEKTLERNYTIEEDNKLEEIKNKVEAEVKFDGKSLNYKEEFKVEVIKEEQQEEPEGEVEQEEQEEPEEAKEDSKDEPEGQEDLGERPEEVKEGTDEEEAKDESKEVLDEEAEQEVDEDIEDEELLNEMGYNPDGLSGPTLIKAPYIQTYAPGSLGPFKNKVVQQMMSSISLQNHPGDHDNIEPPAPGSLDIDKTATATANPNQWKIDLTLTGKDIPTTSDIVLVIDRSGSMSSGGRMTSAKAAAKEFVNTLLSDSSKTGTRIAVVSFASNVTEHSGFQGFNGKASLISDIEGLTASGGTFIQAGLRQASVLLDGSSADSKNIVLLGDGAATYSYKINNPNNYLEYWNTTSSWGRTYRNYRTNSNVIEDDFDYGSTVGNGSDDHHNYESGNDGSNWNPDRYRNYYRHGASSIAEAGFAKAKGYTTYTIPLGAGTEGDWTLDGIASPGNAYTGGTDDLSPIFQTIAGSISFAATDATITDPMGPMFSIPGINASNYASKITVNRGTISWDDTTETITWNLDTISEGNPATMSYIVEIDNSAVSGQLYPTNKHTYVDYTNALDTGARKTFPIPEVGINAGRIKVHHYRVNSQGQPINSLGQPITRAQAELESYNYGSVPLSFNTPYTVSGPATITVGGIDYKYNPVGNQGDPNPTDVTLTPANPSKDVWFGYEEMKFTSVTVTKNVTGNMANQDKEFQFKATLTDGNTNIDFNPGQPSGVNINGNEATFTLKHGEEVTLIDIPVGSKITVTETDSAGYVVSYTVDGGTSIVGSIAEIENIEFSEDGTSIEFTNNKDTIIDTGISLDNLPYIILLVLVGLGILGRFIWRRKYKIE